MKETAPLSTNSVSVRTDAFKGIRFKAVLTQSLKEKEETTEFGFIVTRKVLLGSVAENDFTMETDVNYIKGEAYIKGSLDKVFENDGKFNYFTAVIYNLPIDQYDDVLVVRPYLIHNGVTTYGDTVSSSMRNAAQTIKNSEAYKSMDEAEKAKIDAIINA